MEDNNNGENTARKKSGFMSRFSGLGCLGVVYAAGLLACLAAGLAAPKLFISKTAVFATPSGLSSAASDFVFDISEYKVRARGYVQQYIRTCTCNKGSTPELPQGPRHRSVFDVANTRDDGRNGLRIVGVFSVGSSIFFPVSCRHQRCSTTQSCVLCRTRKVPFII